MEHTITVTLSDEQETQLGKMSKSITDYISAISVDINNAYTIWLAEYTATQNAKYLELKAAYENQNLSNTDREKILTILKKANPVLENPIA